MNMCVYFPAIDKAIDICVTSMGLIGLELKKNLRLHEPDICEPGTYFTLNAKKTLFGSIWILLKPKIVLK